MKIEIKPQAAPTRVEQAHEAHSNGASNTVLIRGNAISSRPDQGVAVAETKATRQTITGRPQGALSEDGLTSRVTALDVGESLSAAVRFEKKPTGEAAEKAYRGMAASLHAGSQRAKTVREGMEFKLERGCFETRDRALIYVVALTRLA